LERVDGLLPLGVLCFWPRMSLVPRLEYTLRISEVRSSTGMGKMASVSRKALVKRAGFCMRVFIITARRGLCSVYDCTAKV
jgi:hypothetical protein